MEFVGAGLVCWGATCLGWGCWRCCCASGRVASSGPEWQQVEGEEIQDIPRICRVILAVYEKDLQNPAYADRLHPEGVVKKANYDETKNRSPPYLVYIDHEAKDICLAVRGLNLGNAGDYTVLMSRKKGQEFFDGGYVHAGLLQSARWLLDREHGTLEALAKQHPEYTVTLAGHSLGSGIASLMAILLRRMSEEGKTRILPEGMRCYGIAPARSMSLNLAVRHADIIKSVVLQDDFLPRTSAPIQSVLSASCCLPCFLCFKCTGDVLMSDEQKLMDRRRLYVPGRLFHILYKQDFSCSTEGPSVLTAIPLLHRFERVVFSWTMVDDHSIVNIERKATQAFQGIPGRGEGAGDSPPGVQTMKRDFLVNSEQQRHGGEPTHHVTSPVAEGEEETSNCPRACATGTL